MAIADSDIEPVLTFNPGGVCRVVLVCEHASATIPAAYENLGLSEEASNSHIAWDPGALAVSRLISDRLDTKLIAGGLSRLVYDCNRPPEAPDAIPQRSEVFDVPGNVGLSQAERRVRHDLCHAPLHAEIERAMTAVSEPILITVHSFTPIYNGRQRTVEIGVLHDTDSRLADVLLAIAPEYLGGAVQRNAPYGPSDGVTHTLREHALPHRAPNVMLEIRNDLIATPEQQADMALRLSLWITAASQHQEVAPCTM